MPTAGRADHFDTSVRLPALTLLLVISSQAVTHLGHRRT